MLEYSSGHRCRRRLAVRRRDERATARKARAERTDCVAIEAQ
jgi:hypothetical protein